jgi:hypothetical protein
MIQHPGGIARSMSAVVMVLALPVARATAQKNDEARLTMGISAGWLASSKLWQVPNQPVFSSFSEPDLFSLTREARSDITISGHATYYRGPHLGITGEFTYLGLGTTDGCVLARDNGDAALQAACNALKGTQGSASTTAVQGGVVLRPFARAFLQPYVKGLAGLAFTPSSTISMVSDYGLVGDTLERITIYTDNGNKPIRPSWALAAGFATAPSSGYQLRFEVRDTWLPLREVTGPTSGQGFEPPTRSSIHGFLSVMVAFDIVLEKRRGRRY